MGENEFRRKQELLEAHRRRLHERELQAAKQGINADPEITIEIEDIKKEIQNLERDIVGVLSTSENKEDILNIHAGTINQILSRSPTISRQSRSMSITDVTEYIKIIVKSNRFGRKVQFQVPHDITASAFIDLAVDSLGLPWSKPINELMLSFSFRYSVVFKEITIPLNKTFRDAGLNDGDEVQLSIKSVWTDEIEKAEIEEAKRGPVMYEMGSRMRELAAREEARRARGLLTQSKIKSLADGCFSFVDHIDAL